LPLAGAFLVFIYALPMVVMGMDGMYGAAWGTLACALVAVAIGLLFGPFYSIAYIFTAGFPGVAMGGIVFISARGGSKPNGADMLFYGTICSLAFKIILAVIIWRLADINIMSPNQEAMQNYITSAVGNGLDRVLPGDAETFKESISQSALGITLLIPFGMILWSVGEAWASYGLASRLSKKRGGEAFFVLPPFSGWAFPRNVLLAFVVGLVGDYVGQERDMYAILQAGANLCAVTGALFSVQGLAVACFFMERRNIPRIARAPLIVLTLFIPILSYIFCIVGIIDMGFNIRRLPKDS
jgi:uncharacterized protein YybS (DUF2232 family)